MQVKQSKETLDGVSNVTSDRGSGGGGVLCGYQAGGRAAPNWRQSAMLTEMTRTIAAKRAVTGDGRIEFQEDI